MSGENLTRRRLLSLSGRTAVVLGFGASASGCSDVTKPRRTIDTPAGGDITAFATMSGRLIAGDELGGVYIWDTTSWSLTQSDPSTLPTYHERVDSISPLGTDSVVVSQDSLNIYNAKSAALEHALYSSSWTPDTTKQDSATSVVLGDGRIADGTASGVVRIWDVSSGTTTELTDGVESGYPVSFAVDPAGTRLAAGFTDLAHAVVGLSPPTSVLVWDIQTLKVVAEYTTGAPWVEFDASGRLLYCATDGFAVDPAPAGFARYATDADLGAYDATRNIVALGGRTEIFVVDCATGRELKKVVGSDERRFGPLAMLDAGRTLVCGLEGGVIGFWDI